MKLLQSLIIYKPVSSRSCYVVKKKDTYFFMR